MKQQHRWYESPYVAQWVSIIQYLVKLVAKVMIGRAIASHMMIGDGFHNGGDAVQALIVMGAIWLKKKGGEDYPFRFKEIESIFTGAIGLSLAATGLSIGWHSALGIMAHLPGADRAVREYAPFLPVHESVRLETAWLRQVVLTGGSAVISLLISRYQIWAGKRFKEPTVVADGLETKADAWIEFMTLAGVVLVQCFGLKIFEYILGLVVMVVVLHTSKELVCKARDSLFKRSLGKDVEDSVRQLVQAIYGVEGVPGLITFRIGRGLVMCIVSVSTHLDDARHRSLRYAIQRALTARLMEVEDAREVNVYLTLMKPTADSKRIAYAISWIDGRPVTASPHDATHLLIRETIPEGTRAAAYPIEGGDIASSAAKHRVACVHYAGDAEDGVRVSFSGLKVELIHTRVSDPQLEIGVKLLRPA